VGLNRQSWRTTRRGTRMTAIGSTWGSESSKKPQQRGIIRRTRDSAFDAGGETEGLGHFEDSERCGDSGYLKYRILRTLTAQCVLLRSVRSSPIGNNMLTISSFLPAIISISCRMHGEFLRLLFLQAHGRPRRISLPLESRRNTINRTRSVSSARHSTSR
jgi:hypothetical protein